MNLTGAIVGTESLSEQDKSRMFELLALHFDGADRANFDNDLREKPWAILLREAGTGVIQGFSTIIILNAAVDGIKIKALFSGDTIVNKDHWGEMELGRLWLKFVFDFMGKNKGARLYWFLISQGYRTYSYLPIYFNEFYPRFDKPFAPFEKKVLDILAEQKFPGEYDAAKGIIRFKNPKDHLKPGLADINPKRFKNPHTKFFAETNPFHYKGEELACIAPLRPDNFKPIAYRVLAWNEKPSS